LPEYYLTRAETQILKIHSEEIISNLSEDVLLVELGSGSCIKTQYIIEELLNQREKLIYSPIDISPQMLQESANSLLERFQDLEIISVAAEYEEGLRQIEMHHDQPKLILWLGSSIGNFNQKEAVDFLKSIVRTLSKNDSLLIGFDLDKDRTILEKAYDDSSHITAEFNLNLLGRINRELGGEFDTQKFKHLALYNDSESRIELYVVSTCDQDVFIADLNQTFHFDINEKIHTENSHKFSGPAIEEIASQTGMRIINEWFDSERYFNVTLFRAQGQ
jgi:L-histidine N-alpha-methyltransferase